MQKVNILESRVSYDVVALDIPTDPMSQPLKIRKVNIGTKENPKYANIGDYWDDEMHISQIYCVSSRISFRHGSWK